MTRQEKIDALVSNLVDVCCNDTSFLVSVIRNGFKGYEEMTDTEIEAEYADYISNEEISK